MKFGEIAIIGRSATPDFGTARNECGRTGKTFLKHRSAKKGFAPRTAGSHSTADKPVARELSIPRNIPHHRNTAGHDEDHREPEKRYQREDNSSGPFVANWRFGHRSLAWNGGAAGISAFALRSHRGQADAESSRASARGVCGVDRLARVSGDGDAAVDARSTRAGACGIGGLVAAEPCGACRHSRDSGRHH